MRKLLILAANPPDTGRLAHGEELRAIKREIQAGPSKDAFELIVNEAARFGELVAMLSNIRPEIVHLSGHFRPDGCLILADDTGASHPTRAPSSVRSARRSPPYETATCRPFTR